MSTAVTSPEVSSVQEITPGEMRAHEFLVISALVERALPEGSASAVFDVSLPVDESMHVTIGRDIGSGDVAIVPSLIAVHREEAAVEFTFATKDSNILLAPPAARGYMFQASDGSERDKFAAFTIRAQADTITLGGYTPEGEYVPFKTDIDQEDEFPNISKLALACAQAIQKKTPKHYS
jgi:hypothetical protein